MAVERSVAFGGDIGFSDDELGEMKARVSGQASPVRATPRVSVDDLPRLTGPRTMQDLRVVDANGMTSTVRQAVFDPADVLVESAFDAVAPPSAKVTAERPVALEPPPLAPPTPSPPSVAPSAPIAARPSPASSVPSVIIADGSPDWSHDDDGIEPADHAAPAVAERRDGSAVPRPLSVEVSLPRATPALSTPAVIIAPGPGAAAPSDAITSKQRIVATPAEAIPVARARPPSPASSVASRSPLPESTAAGGAPSPAAPPPSLSASPAFSTSGTLVSLPPPPPRIAPPPDARASVPATTAVDPLSATPATALPVVSKSAVEEPIPASAAITLPLPIISSTPPPPPLTVQAPAISPPPRPAPVVERAPEKPPEKPFEKPPEKPIDRPRPVIVDAVYSSAPPPDAAMLRFNLPHPFTAPVVVGNVTPRRDVTPAIGIPIATPPVAIPTAAPARAPAHALEREEESEELDGVELEEVHATPAPSAAAPPPPVEARSDRTRRAPPPPPPAVGGAAAQAPITVTVNAAAATPMPADPGPDPGEVRGRRKRRSKPWFEDLFDDDWLRTLPPVDGEQTRRETDFIAAALSLDASATLLDLACGTGRHAVALAARGHTVTGLDLSLPLLIRAADAARKAEVTVDFVHGDMREMTYDGRFDAAYCFFSSFGYFDDEINRGVIVQLAKALKPGGRLLLDLVNRDYVVNELPARVWWQADGCMVLEEVDFNYYGSRIQSRRSVVFEDGRQLEHDVSLRTYSLHEIGKLLHGAGFRVTEVSGGLAQRGRFFGTESRQILIVAEKK